MADSSEQDNRRSSGMTGVAVLDPGDDTPENQISRIKDSGNAFIKAGSFERAAQRYTDALDLADGFKAAGRWTLGARDTAVLYANRSCAHLSARGTDDRALECARAALADARAAVSLDPGYPKAHHRLGQALQALGDTTDAAAGAFAACQQLQRREAAAAPRAAAEAHHRAGGALEDRGDYGGAEAAYRRAVAADPGHAAAHGALAGLLMAVRADYPGAVAAYRAAVALEPGRTEGRGNLCGMLAMAGDFAGAEREARRLIALLPPGDPEGSECLERVLEEKEKAAEARYEKAM